MQVAVFALLSAVLFHPATMKTVAQSSNAAVADVDSDGDGWTVAQGDCHDVALPGTPYPELINPGALDVPGNGIDDDCDGIVDNPRPVCDVGLASNATDPFLYAKAIDLCQTTTETPLLPQRRWGVINAELLLADGTGTPDVRSRSIRSTFGSANFPQFGNGLAVLSTGSAAASGQTNPAFASFQTSAAIGTQSAFPADWFLANGSVLPNAPGCPTANGSFAYDPVMLKLRIRVPTNARSFRVATRWFTADYPEWICSPYNDYYLVLLDSVFNGLPANPSDKNLAKYVSPNNTVYLVGSGLASGHTALFQACKNGLIGCNTPGSTSNQATCTNITDLTGTGFDLAATGCNPGGDPVGGGTAWLQTAGNVVPGETIELRFVMWDTSDGTIDSLALLDNFEWSTEPTTPGTFLLGQVPRPNIVPSAPTGVDALVAPSSTAVTVTWNVADSATSYRIFRREPGQSFGQIGTVSAPPYSYLDTNVAANTAYLYMVRAVNNVGPSTDSVADLATTTFFSNDPLVANETVIDADHLAQLRDAANKVRQLAGLSSVTFSDSASPGVPVRAMHVNEVRSALDEALDALGFATGGYTESLAIGIRVKAQHFQEIRDRVR